MINCILFEEFVEKWAPKDPLLRKWFEEELIEFINNERESGMDDMMKDFYIAHNEVYNG